MVLIIAGAISPFDQGANYIQSALEYITTNTNSSVLSATILQLAALNLLPIPSLGGAQVYLELLPQRGFFSPFIYPAGLTCVLIIYISWLIALGYFLIFF